MIAVHNILHGGYDMDFSGFTFWAIPTKLEDMHSRIILELMLGRTSSLEESSTHGMIYLLKGSN